MSRSLVGSSSSRTFGSLISSRMSCSRRRSPPLRSLTSVRCFSPLKPKRSTRRAGRQLAAVAEARVAAHLLDRLQHAQVAGDLGRVLGEVREPHGLAVLDRPRVGLQLLRQHPRQRRLARAVDADQPDPVARADVPVHPLQQHLRAERQPDALGLDHLAAQPRGGELAAARRGRGPRARRRSSRSRPRSGTWAWRSAPAARAAATRAPCAAAAGGGPRAPRPAARARPAPARRPRSRPRTGARRRR